MAQPCRLPHVERLPVEIKGQIFSEVVSNMYNRQALAGLCLVSKSWKQTAYGDPKLWTTLTIDANEPEESAMVSSEQPEIDPRLRTWIMQYLGRSGVLPLHISVRADSFVSAPLECFALDIFAPRIASLEMMLQRECNWQGESRQRNWTALERLKLSIEDLGPRSCLAFSVGSLPRLRSLSLTGDSLADCLRVFPWVQLVRLDLNIDSAGVDFLDMLGKCRDLEECSLTAGSLELYDDRAPHSISLSKLSKLELRIEHPVWDSYSPADGENCGDILLKYLKVPKLLKLEIEYVIGAPLSPNALLSMVHTSRCRLQSLVLDGVEIPGEQAYNDVLRALPDLTSLHFNVTDPPTDFLCCGPDYTFLPHLEWLWFGDVDRDINAIEEKLLEFVRIRNEFCPCTDPESTKNCPGEGKHSQLLEYHFQSCMY